MKKTKMKKIIMIIFGVILILILSKNLIIKSVIQTGCRSVTGLPLDIGKLNVNVTGSFVDIKDLKIKNPKGFEKDPLMLDLPEIFVDYRFQPLLGGKVHLDDIRLHLSNFILVTKADGSSNLDSLKALQQASSGDQEKKEVKKADKKETELQVDNLSLKIDKVTWIAYDEEGQPSVTEINVNLDEHHKDIEDLNKVILLIVYKSLWKAPQALKALKNVDFGGIGGALTGVLGSSAGAAIDAAGSALNTTADSTKKALEGVTGELKGKTEGLKKIIKNPFGKKD